MEPEIEIEIGIEIEIEIETGTETETERDTDWHPFLRAFRLSRRTTGLSRGHLFLAV